MMYRDGTRISEGLLPQRKFFKKLPLFVTARIDEIIYTDDKRNSTTSSDSKEIEYNCTIVGGPYDGLRIFHVKDTVSSGGKYNKSGQVRTPLSEGKIEPPIDKPQTTDGDYVLIAFIYGSPHNARIISGIPHPQGGALDIKKEDKSSSFFEYNGVFFGVNKDGALSISFGGGPKDKDGNATDEAAAGSAITISKSGGITISDGNGQSIEIDKANNSVKMSSSQGMQMDAGSGFTMNVSGAVTIKGGGTLDLSGAVVKVGSGGNLAARVGDLALGKDSRGAPVLSTIQTGSSTTLIGG